MASRARRIPRFKTEDDERSFWARHSPLDYFPMDRAHRVSFPDLRPSLRSISLRLPEDMLVALKEQANRQDVPYQSLAKIYLAREIRHEGRSNARSRLAAARTA